MQISSYLALFLTRGFEGPRPYLRAFFGLLEASLQQFQVPFEGLGSKGGVPKGVILGVRSGVPFEALLALLGPLGPNAVCGAHYMGPPARGPKRGSKQALLGCFEPF